MEERGVRAIVGIIVGVILLIVILSVTFIFKKFDNDKRTPIIIYSLIINHNLSHEMKYL